MLPSLKATSFGKKEDIANAFSDLDIIASTPPTTLSQAPKSRDLNRGNASKPLPLDEAQANDEAKANDKLTFLTLPTEIRLRIYNLLLVSRCDSTVVPSLGVGNTDQKMMSTHTGPNAGQFVPYRTRLEARILQTCKQIYHEANPMLYSQNVFTISNPEEALRFIERIGLVNLKMVKILYIWVPWMFELMKWLQLLDLLVAEASGLRYMELAWSASFEFSGRRERRVFQRGLGCNLDFVRALGRIRGLEELVIEGYYGARWPAYLEERMRVRVRAIRGHSREPEPGSREAHLKVKGSMFTRFRRRGKERDVRAFIMYQKGTEDLIP